ncbi:hypothetical protein ABZ769_32990 [Streptomyces olivoreticuli]
MAETKPRSPNREANLRHGGYASDTCPRCGHVRSGSKPRHSVPELVDNKHLRDTVGEIYHAMQADKKLAPDAAVMLGVLEARVRGNEYYFAACSSGLIDISPYLKEITYHKGAWQVAKPAVPSVKKKPLRWDGQWKTIKGEKVDIPLTANGVEIPHLDQTCAAVKLLLELGNRVSKSGKSGQVEYVRMSEQYYVGPENTTASREWHGKGATCSWTAHSCGPCNIRIPYLICDVPSNWIENA